MNVSWHDVRELLAHRAVVTGYSAVFLAVGAYSLTKPGTVNHALGVLLLLVGLASVYEHVTAADDDDPSGAPTEPTARR